MDLYTGNTSDNTAKSIESKGGKVRDVRAIDQLDYWSLLAKVPRDQGLKKPEILEALTESLERHVDDIRQVNTQGNPVPQKMIDRFHHLVGTVRSAHQPGQETEDFVEWLKGLYQDAGLPFGDTELALRDGTL